MHGNVVEQKGNLDECIKELPTTKVQDKEESFIDKIESIRQTWKLDLDDAVEVLPILTVGRQVIC